MSPASPHIPAAPKVVNLPDAEGRYQLAGRVVSVPRLCRQALALDASLAPPRW